MLTETRKLFRYFLTGKKLSWWEAQGEGVCFIRVGGRNDRIYRVTIDATGGFEVRSEKSDTLMDKSGGAPKAGIQAHQFQKDQDLVVVLFGMVRTQVIKSYAEDVKHMTGISY